MDVVGESEQFPAGRGDRHDPGVGGQQQARVGTRAHRGAPWHETGMEVSAIGAGCGGAEWDDQFEWCQWVSRGLVVTLSRFTLTEKS
ncbi:hypothetical protein GCM10027447_05650 [Glycomyces halotolerans]